MRARLILNLVLLVVLAVGGGLLSFEPWAEPPDKDPRLVDVEPDAVDRVTIERTGDDGGTVVLERGNAGWRIAEPVAMRASETAVEGLIENLRQRTKDQFAAGERDLAGFGLDTPTVRVTLGATTVALGGEAPIERARYARVGETIHMVAGGLARAADRPATGFVARRLVPEDAEISAIERETFRVVRATNTDAATWSVARSNATPAKGAAKTLTSAWSGATAVDVKQREGGDAPDPMIRVHLKGREEPLRFIRLGAEGGDTDNAPTNVAITRPDLPVRYTVTGPTAERLFTLERKTVDSTGGSDQKS